jgi:hypothetical protein
MLKKVNIYKKLLQWGDTRIHAAAIVAVMIFVGFVGVYGIKAATYIAKSEAETGTITGNASLNGDATASGGNSVAFGRGNGPAAPNTLLTFTGGNSIALRWSESTAISSIKQYNIFRNGTQVGSVTPGWHANFPEKDGNGYIDSNVTGGSTYSYQVQAVSTANVTSALSSSVSATQPTSTTPVPNITYTMNGQTDLEPFIRDTVIPFLKIWYPKVADYEAFPGYSVPSSLSINVDPTYTGSVAETDFGTAAMRFRPGYLRQNPHDLGAFLHEATHALQGIHGQPNPDSYPNSPSWTWEAGADFSREFLLHDRDSGRPSGTQYYTDGFGPGSYFLNYIQTHYDSQYVRKLTVAGHNRTFGAANVTFGGNKNIDEVWAEMLGLPSHTGAFTSMASNKCMDDPAASTTKGTNIQIYDCNGSMAQKFTAQRDASGISTLHVMADCIEVQDAGTANGTLVRYWECNGNVAQQWIVHADGTIVNPNSGKCLEVHGGNTTSANGTLLGIWDCAGAAWQKWNVPSGTLTN